MITRRSPEGKDSHNLVQVIEVIDNSFPLVLVALRPSLGVESSFADFPSLSREKSPPS